MKVKSVQISNLILTRLGILSLKFILYRDYTFPRGRVVGQINILKSILECVLIMEARKMLHRKDWLRVYTEFSIVWGVSKATDHLS